MAQLPFMWREREILPSYELIYHCVCVTTQQMNFIRRVRFFFSSSLGSAPFHIFLRSQMFTPLRENRPV